jgi:hypothetical protein
MKPNLHKHLVKPLIWRDGPEGLYDHKLFWMEGSKDMEGFGSSFCYGFVEKEGKLLPQDGHLVHPFDTALAFVSVNHDDILDLGATVSVEIGEERETYTFTDSQIVVIPKGTQYGNITVSDMKHPFAQYSVYLAPEYAAEAIPSSALKDPKPGDKWRGYAFRYTWAVNEKGEIIHAGGAIDYDGSGMGYSRLTDERGVMHPLQNMGANGMGPGNADALLWVYGEQMHDLILNTLWGHYTQCGKWHRAGEQHTHPNEEVLVTVGIDPKDPLNIGAEVEIGMGPEDERYFANVPTVWICPKNFEHLPQITRWCDRPFGFFVINNDNMHDSPWKDKEGARIETDE